MLAVWLRWVAGMEIFLGSCESYLSLPNSFSLLFDLAVPSTQGACVCQPGLGGRGWSLSMLGWGTVALLREEPRSGIADLCLSRVRQQTLHGAAVQDCATCLGWDESLDSQNWAEALPGQVHRLCSAWLLWYNHLCPCGLSSRASPLFPISSQALCVAQHWGLHQSGA